MFPHSSHKPISKDWESQGKVYHRNTSFSVPITEIPHFIVPITVTPHFSVPVTETPRILVSLYNPYFSHCCDKVLGWREGVIVDHSWRVSSTTVKMSQQEGQEIAGYIASIEKKSRDEGRCSSCFLLFIHSRSVVQHIWWHWMPLRLVFQSQFTESISPLIDMSRDLSIKWF